jgi:hypothetical protein
VRNTGGRRAAPAFVVEAPDDGPALCCLTALISDVAGRWTPAHAAEPAAKQTKRAATQQRPRGEQPSIAPRSPQDVLYPEAASEGA